MTLHPHPEAGKPSKAAIREYLRWLDRTAARGERPATLAGAMADVIERAALFELLRGRKDAARKAERRSPGILDRLYKFSAEGGW